jgi:hypothetical protein
MLARFHHSGFLLRCGASDPGFHELLDRRTRWMQVMARLNQGMTLQKAETGLQPWFKAMLQENMRRADSASWLVLHDAPAMILSGIGIGLPFVWALSRLVGSQLYDVKPSDPAVIAIAIVVLCSAGLGAALIPAHRASRVNPTDALRFE